MTVSLVNMGLVVNMVLMMVSMVMNLVLIMVSMVMNLVQPPKGWAGVEGERLAKEWEASWALL